MLWGAQRSTAHSNVRRLGNPAYGVTKKTQVKWKRQKTQPPRSKLPGTVTTWRLSAACSIAMRRS